MPLESGTVEYATREEAVKAALKNVLIAREELRCAEIQDHQSMVVAVTFGSIFVLAAALAFVGGLASVIAGRLALAVLLGGSSVVLFGLVYFVKMSYDYGRRSYKIALNLTKDALEEYSRIGSMDDLQRLIGRPR